MVASIFTAVAQALAQLGERRRESPPRALPASAPVASAGTARRAAAVAVFSWQDRRAHPGCASSSAHGDAVHRKTGLFLSPHYGASKLRWALDHLPAVRAARAAGTLCWGPQASFLVFRLPEERTLVRRSAVRGAHAAVEPRHPRLGPGVARAVRSARRLPAAERAHLPPLGHAARGRHGDSARRR